MGLSSNTITHFTKDLKSLKGILLQTFKVNYCREKLKATKSGQSDFLVPVVSFSDIPFSQVRNHVKSYGSYGIGLSKQWAERKGLNPVLYVDKNSNLASNFYKNLYGVLLAQAKSFDDFSPENKNIFDIIRYMKNYQGDLERENKQTKKDYRFSDEREWRYVLPLESKSPMLQNCKNKSNQQVKDRKKELNNQINEYLSFGPQDINYIIINTEKQRDSIIKTIKKIKDAHDEKIVARLTSRIISVEQIKHDF